MKIINKRAGYEYNLLERFEAGISLTGAEAQAIRKGHADLGRSFAKIISGELFLVNTNIPVSNAGAQDSTRSRKLLVHKHEITSLETRMKALKLTLIPTKVYNKGHRIKVELALARSKKQVDKKEVLKKRDIERDTQRALRGEKDNDSRV